MAVVSVFVLALLASGLLMAAPVGRADHDTVGWASMGNVVPFSTVLSNRNPYVLPDDQGHVYVFYVQTNSTGVPVANLRVAKFNTTGGVIGTSPELWFDKRVNDIPSVVQTNAIISAARDASGNLYVAWTRLDIAPRYNDTYVSKSSDGGNSWLNAVRAGIPDDGMNDQIPTIATAPNGNVYVAWTTSPRNVDWFYNISFAMSTNGGNSFINQRVVSVQGPGGSALIDSLAIDASGRAYIAWISRDGDFNTTGWYHLNMTWSDNGVTWAAPSQLTPTSNIAIYPAFAPDSRGRLNLVWLDYRGAFGAGVAVWYARSADRGATWSAPRPISDGINGFNSLLSMTVHEDTISVSWSGGRNIAGFFRSGLVDVISADGGTSWYSERYYGFSPDTANSSWMHASVDRDGTVWAGVEIRDPSTFSGDGITLLWWNAPPSAPVIQSVGVSGHDATVRWTASPEGDVAGYSVWRSADGTNWAFVANVGGTTTSYADTNLANGTYWYQVRAIDSMGTESHGSASAVAQVGPSLQDQIDALQQALNNLQSTSSADYNNLKDQITALQQALNSLQSQGAMQSTALLNTGLEVVIVVLLALVLYMQIRKPKNPRPVIMAPQPGSAQPGQPTSRFEEEL